MRKHTVKDVLTYIKSLPIGSRVYLIVPLHIPSGRSLAAHLEIQLQQGYSRLWTEDGIVAIEDALLWKDDRAEGFTCSSTAWRSVKSWRPWIALANP